jgi:hypothetical protein
MRIRIKIQIYASQRNEHHTSRNEEKHREMRIRIKIQIYTSQRNEHQTSSKEILLQNRANWGKGKKKGLFWRSEGISGMRLRATLVFAFIVDERIKS